MNQGKRYLRNTLLGMHAAVLAFIGIHRLHASIPADAPQWMHAATSLGLRETDPTAPREEFKELDLASLRDFTEVGMTGDFNVEIVGAAEYKVSFTPATDRPAKIRANLTDGVLRLSGENTRGGSGAATLRIEAPSLTAIRARQLPQLTVHGLHAEKLSVRISEVAELRLEENQVAEWDLTSYQPETSVHVDKATFSAGSMLLHGNMQMKLRD